MTQQTVVPSIPQEAPKTIHEQYFVVVLKPNMNSYNTCLLCKNYTEAKKEYKRVRAEAEAGDLIKLLMTVNRIAKDYTYTSDIVVAQTVKGLK